MLCSNPQLSSRSVVFAEKVHLNFHQHNTCHQLILYEFGCLRIGSVQEYHNGGERDVMLEEIANLRDQLLEVLDGKIAVDQGLVPLTTPQVCYRYVQIYKISLVICTSIDILLRNVLANFDSDIFCAEKSSCTRASFCSSGERASAN